MWYYMRDGQQIGPIRETELLDLATDGEVTPETMVWKQGLPQWQRFAVVQANMSSAAPLPVANPEPCGLAMMSAIFGLCCLVSLFFSAFGLFLSIPAVLCGHFAKRQIRKSGGTRSGNDVAFAGLVSGYMGIIFLLVALLPTSGGSLIRPRQLHCAMNLIQIGKACKMYAMDYRESFPTSFEVMMKEKYLDAARVYVCLGTEHQESFDTESFADHQYDSYRYFGAGETNSSAGKDTVIAADRDGNHRNYFNVLCGDGQVQNFTGTDLETIARENHLRIPGLIEP